MYIYSTLQPFHTLNFINSSCCCGCRMGRVRSKRCVHSDCSLSTRLVALLLQKKEYGGSRRHRVYSPHYSYQNESHSRGILCIPTQEITLLDALLYTIIRNFLVFLIIWWFLKKTRVGVLYLVVMSDYLYFIYYCY